MCAVLTGVRVLSTQLSLLPPSSYPASPFIRLDNASITRRAGAYANNTEQREGLPIPQVAHETHVREPEIRAAQDDVWVLVWAVDVEGQLHARRRLPRQRGLQRPRGKLR